ncbi:unnamed protein product [Kuraishia capsulata CBS 1993]|uniref:Uncharacterized protein n=1 Tax=Kuraishia capsulata CBS 1993 TaxID=1382522 RepID=W6MX92_9ASCO|nr:uncharacterized protein KUCA_T00004468001 [Kuraishia capsulata CBS 1993]CDK28485.1 unnamed protein product [Kuraishia capsulata CBS 1993]
MSQASAFHEQLQDIDHALAAYRKNQRFVKPTVQQRLNPSLSNSRGLKFTSQFQHQPHQTFHQMPQISQGSHAAHVPGLIQSYQAPVQQSISPLVQQPIMSPFMKPQNGSASGSGSISSSSSASTSASSIEDILSPRFDPFSVKLPRSTEIVDLNLSTGKLDENKQFGAFRSNIWGNDMSVWG